MPISPHIESTLSHKFSSWFSPTTATAILNCRNRNHGQEPSSSINNTRRTSPRLQPAAAHTHGGASSQGLPSGATTESRRGGGTNTNTAPTPAGHMPFDSVGWETPIGTYSVSSISHSAKSPSRRSDVATYPLAVKRAKRTPNTTEGKGSFCSVDDADDGGDKYDSEDDIIPAATGCPILTIVQPKTLRRSCSLLKNQQNLLRSTTKNSLRGHYLSELSPLMSLSPLPLQVLQCAGSRRTLTISSMSSRIGVWV